ncbi:MAG: glycosyltransferase family 9 protein [Bacteroidales bacterium]
MKQRHIIILRFSAIGDIAIAAPLVRAYAKANPDIRFTMVSVKLLEPLFVGIPNLNFKEVNFKDENHTFRHVIQVAKEILALNPTEIADIHDVLRTKVIRTYLKINGIKNVAINKNRAQRKKFINPHNSKRVALMPMQKRYEEVFVRLGLKNLHFNSQPVPQRDFSKYKYHRIGIAPFAKHKGKSWSTDSMEEVIKTLSQDPSNLLYFFGAKGEEAKLLQEWQKKYKNCETIAGHYTMSEELDFIKSLDLMISMDSANMHLASYVHTPVISIWGATHPDAGFYGWGQDRKNAIQIDDLDCRPCSIYGDKECARGDYACLERITPEMVIDRIHAFFEKK